MQHFADTLTLDAKRRTRDGYLAVRAKVARTGVYEYAGREIDPDNAHGLRDKALVHVLRDNDTVFDKSSARSFVGKPITDDHPHEAVTADNWKDLARGVIMGAMREGDYLAFDLLLTDAETIRKVDGGKRELSNGYGAELQFGDFKAPCGTLCEARQVGITGNHVALVDRGRAGSACAIADAAICERADAGFLAGIIADGETYSVGGLSDKNIGNQISPVGASLMATKQITFDGMPIEVTDQAEAAIRKVEGKLAVADKRATEAEASVATLTTEKATLDAKVVTLEKQIEDAKLTPAQLRDAARSYQATADKAKALGVTITDDMDEGGMQRAAVNARMGDAAKDWTDDQISASFALIAKDAKPQGRDPVRDVIRDGAVTLTDSSTIHSAARAARVR